MFQEADLARQLDSLSRWVLLATPEMGRYQTELLHFVERTKVPVLATPDFPNVFPMDHSLAAGHATFASPHFSERVIEACDGALVLGDPSDFAVSGFTGKPLLRLLEGGQPETAGTQAAGDGLRWTTPCLADSLQVLSIELGRHPRTRSQWFHEMKRGYRRPTSGSFPVHAGLIDPRAAAMAIVEELPDQACFTADIGDHATFVLQNGYFKPGHRVLFAIERSACMGHPFVASIGMRVATGLPTLAVVGDGCFRRVCSEIHSMTEKRIGGWACVVWLNGGYGMVRAGMNQLHGEGHGLDDGSWIRPPDFARVAQGLGAQVFEANDLKNLKWAIRCGLACPSVPCVILAHIDPSIPAPSATRFRQLHGASKAAVCSTLPPRVAPSDPLGLDSRFNPPASANDP